MISLFKIHSKNCSVLVSFLHFLRYPTPKKILDIGISAKVKIVLKLLIIEMPIMFIILLVVAAFEYLNILPMPDNSLPDLLNRLGLVLILILGVIVLPGIEEMIFRSYLVLPKFLNNYVWNKKFGYVFYASAIIFAGVHVLNFPDETQAILFAPIVLVPQFIVGIFAGYLRVKFGIIWGFVFHSIHNLIFLSLFILFDYYKW